MRDVSLKAECIGDKLVLSINGQPIGEVVDEELGIGKVGLVALADQTSGFGSIFDNFWALKP
jgi:hypothetical protein